MTCPAPAASGSAGGFGSSGDTEWALGPACEFAAGEVEATVLLEPATDWRARLGAEAHGRASGGQRHADTAPCPPSGLSGHGDTFRAPPVNTDAGRQTPDRPTGPRWHRVERR